MSRGLVTGTGLDGAWIVTYQPRIQAVTPCEFVATTAQTRQGVHLLFSPSLPLQLSLWPLAVPTLGAIDSPPTNRLKTHVARAFTPPSPMPPHPVPFELEPLD